LVRLEKNSRHGTSIASCMQPSRQENHQAAAAQRAIKKCRNVNTPVREETGTKSVVERVGLVGEVMVTDAVAMLTALAELHKTRLVPHTLNQTRHPRPASVHYGGRRLVRLHHVVDKDTDQRAARPVGTVDPLKILGQARASVRQTRPLVQRLGQLYQRHRSRPRKEDGVLLPHGGRMRGCRRSDRRRQSRLASDFRAPALLR